MKQVNINELLEKYWDGETTLDEERLIQEYDAKGLLPDSPENVLFSYFAAERANSYAKEVQMPQVKPKARSWRVLLSIAASVVILAIAFVQLSPRTQQQDLQDPEEALQVTLAALSMIDGSVDKSELTVKAGLEQFDKTRIFNLN